MVLILRTPELAEQARTLRSSRRKSTSEIIARPEPIDGPGNEDEQALSDQPQQNIQPDWSPDDVAGAAQEALQALQAEQAAEAADAAERAYNDGYQVGLETGEVDGRAAYAAGLAQLEALASNLQQAARASLELAEDDMVAMVYAAVCKIAGTTLLQPDGVRAVIVTALAHSRATEEVVIRVNRSDLDMIDESASFGAISNANWHADEAVSMGGCMVDSAQGTLDARLETQLEQLKSTLANARREARAAGKEAQ
jgi:flagellar assembly protein FliH